MNNIIDNDFNIDNLTFQDTIFKNTNYGFKKIFPEYKYGEKNSGKILIQTPELTSFGINGKKFDTQYINTFSIVMYDKNHEPNDEQKNIIKCFEQILEKTKKYLKNSAIIKKLEKTNSTKLWILNVDQMKLLTYQKDKETEKIIEESPPALYAKLKTKYEKDKTANPEIETPFRDINGKFIDPESLKGVKCKAICLIGIDSIYIKEKCSFQFKLEEALITEIDSSRKQTKIKIPQRFLELKKDEEEEEEEFLNKKIIKIEDETED